MDAPIKPKVFLTAAIIQIEFWAKNWFVYLQDC